MFTLAHLSDLHLAPMPKVAALSLANKRYFGYQSWRRRRASIHLRSIADAVRDDVCALAPDHVAITGDLINISLEAEFAVAREWLHGFGDSRWISVIPGNHDAYVPMSWERGIGTWTDFMTSDRGNGLDDVLPESPFPYVRRRGDIVLIGLSTAVPTAPFVARGRLGGAQIAALSAILERLSGQHLFRVILIHHPPLTGQNRWRKAMADTDAFTRVVQRHGADLVLHGHNHRQMRSGIELAGRRIPVFGVASASARHSTLRPAAHYNIYRLERRAAGWSCAVEIRAWDDVAQQFHTVDRFEA